MRASRIPGAIRGAILAAGVQVGLVALLLGLKTAQPPARRETVLLFAVAPRVPAPMAVAPSRGNTSPSPSPPASAPVMPSVMPFLTPSGAAPLPGMAGLGEMLFGCAPERYADLPPEQQARCPKPGAGLAAGSSLMGTRSHVKNEARWRQEWARVHSPALLPCGGFTNLLCLLGKIADGSLDEYGDPGTWPVYAVKQLPPADFRTIQETYDARRHDTAPEAPP